MAALSWLADALKSTESSAVTICNQTENGVLVTDFEEESLIDKGLAGFVTSVTSVTSEKQGIQQITVERKRFFSANDPTPFSTHSARIDEAGFDNAVPPAIDPTHKTTVDLIFNDPETGTVRTIPAGTLCRRFSGTTAAMMAGVHLDFMGQWAANKNIERGHSLILLDGLLRGVSFSDVEPLITSAE